MADVNEVKNVDLNEEEKKAAEAAVDAAVPAVPEKKKLFAKGSKSRKVAGGIGIGIGTLLLGVGCKILYDLGVSNGEKKAVIDVNYEDVTPATPVDTAASEPEEVPFG